MPTLSVGPAAAGPGTGVRPRLRGGQIAVPCLYFRGGTSHRPSFAAADLGRTGYETRAEINADEGLKANVERPRLVCGELMGLCDVTDRNYPKMTLVAKPVARMAISTRSLIPRVCHESIGVLAAVTAATAAVLKGSVAHDLAVVESSQEPSVSVEHPSGELTVALRLVVADRPTADGRGCPGPAHALWKPAHGSAPNLSSEPGETPR